MLCQRCETNAPYSRVALLARWRRRRESSLRTFITAKVSEGASTPGSHTQCDCASGRAVSGPTEERS